MTLNVWTHMALTQSGTTSVLYMNGVPCINSGTYTVANLNRTLNYIGQSNWGGNAISNAFFDEFRIWSYTMTNQQILNSMNSTLQGSESGLLLYYKFDEGNGSTALINSATATGASFNGYLWQGVTYANSVPLSTLRLPAALLRASDHLFVSAVCVCRFIDSKLLELLCWCLLCQLNLLE